jgi:hypothetical protein
MGNSRGKVGIVGFTMPEEFVAGCVIFAASIVAYVAFSWGSSSDGVRSWWMAQP